MYFLALPTERTRSSDPSEAMSISGTQVLVSHTILQLRDMAGDMADSRFGTGKIQDKPRTSYAVRI